MWFFYITGILLLISFLFDRSKTKRALIKAYQKFIFIAPPFLLMLIFVSVILFLFPQEKIIQYLNYGNRFFNVIVAALMGSITIIPGFVAFPLAGILRNSGVLYMVIASFTTTLMMVGILTFPIEVTYFGKKVTLIRNIISFVIALAVSLAIGIYFREIIL